ncbi:MAG: DUF2982 domain-containing protein [Idiomarina sp.]|nr:DUF2982 domain-containing protein [Idiomarina sp.]
MSRPELAIRPSAKRNGLALTAIGATLLLFCLFLNATDAPIPGPVLLLLSVIALVILALGIAKLLEPESSFSITPEHICFRHRKGTWVLPWETIQRFDVPRVQRGLHLQDMPFLGIRLREYDTFLEHLSPRLAVYLMMEQRQILLTALRSEKPEHRDYQEYFDVPFRWKSETGVVYEGVLASFALRMTHLRELLGYDLFISENALDRPAHEFRAFLQELESTRSQHQ